MFNKLSIALCTLISLGVALPRANGQSAPPTWSGTYLGIGIGGKFLSDDISNVQITTPNGAIVPSIGSFARNVQAVRADVFTGHDWQPRQNFVIGISGELGYSFNATASSTLSPSSITINGVAYTPTGTNFQNFSYNYIDKTNLDSNFRLRAGYARSRYLLYAAGGLAVETVRASLYDTYSSGIITINGTTYQLNPGYNNSRSSTRKGSSIGIGADTRLSPHLTFRTEWRYEIFPSQNNSFTAQNNPAYIASNTVSGNEQVLNVGIAYHFDRHGH